MVKDDRPCPLYPGHGNRCGALCAAPSSHSGTPRSCAAWRPLPVDDSSRTELPMEGCRAGTLPVPSRRNRAPGPSILSTVTRISAGWQAHPPGIELCSNAYSGCLTAPPARWEPDFLPPNASCSALSWSRTACNPGGWQAIPARSFSSLPIQGVTACPVVRSGDRVA